MSEPRADASSFSPPQRDLLHPGDVVDERYRIEKYLGGGGMASVYRARHVVLDQPVALKIVSGQVREVAGVAARFIREARAATSLKGPHVARVFDVGTTADGTPYMVMELLEGRDLGDLVERGEPIPVEDAVDWVLQACEALAEVHGRRIVHRDLKPANLFLTHGTDGRPLVKLIDFGISRVDAPLSPKDAHGLTLPEVIMGSPRYMPPETMESATNADVRSDIWGIGAVLYELLVGDAPYDGSSFLEIYAAATKGPPPAPSTVRPEVPAALDRVVLRCLRASPDERYADVAELAVALAPFGREESAARAESIARIVAAWKAPRTDETRAHGSWPSTPPSTPRSRLRRRVSRPPSRVRGLAFAIVAGALAIASTLLTIRASRPRAERPRERDRTTPSLAPAAPPATTATTTATTTGAPPSAPAGSPRSAKRRPHFSPRRPPAEQPPAPAESDDGSLFEDRK